ncbi:MAG: hypothetical protein VB092_03265 [Oscillospiraceae bacterium]|nr:hypothetical protein [Oscillospiraceae bacterium]
MDQKMTEKLNGLFTKKNKTSLIAALLILGVLLLACGGLFEKKEDTQMPVTDDTAYNEQYVKQLQNDVTAFITQMEGVGKASVLVRLETGVQYVYATDGKSSDDTTQTASDSYTSRTSKESSVIIVDGKALVLQRIEPTVQGVVIVCEGGGSAAVREKVTEAVSVLCGIGTNRISVSKMP